MTGHLILLSSTTDIYLFLNPPFTTSLSFLPLQNKLAQLFKKKLNPPFGLYLLTYLALAYI